RNLQVQIDTCLFTGSLSIQRSASWICHAQRSEKFRLSVYISSPVVHEQSTCLTSDYSRTDQSCFSIHIFIQAQKYQTSSERCHPHDYRREFEVDESQTKLEYGTEKEKNRTECHQSKEGDFTRCELISTCDDDSYCRQNEC